MKAMSAMLLALAMVAPVSSVAQDAQATQPDATAIALQLLDRLDAHDYAAAEATFGTQMAAAVPADKLEAVWESLPAQAGAAMGRGQPVVAMQDDVQMVTIPLHYANAELVAKTAVAADGKIIGFLIQPAPPPTAPAPAATCGGDGDDDDEDGDQACDRAGPDRDRHAIDDHAPSQQHPRQLQQ
jgi:hypothetical protein